MTPPRPGVGLVCLPGLEEILGEIAPACDLLEIEPQPFWTALPASGGLRFDAAALQPIIDRGLPTLVHSIGCPVGGTEVDAARQFAPLEETLAALSPPWWSEHMSFLAAGSGEARRQLGFLLPPVQSAESVELFAGHIKGLQDRFGLPFAFETGTNYLQPQPEEIPDGAFWGEIADRADCGILFDLHNVWTNARNGRQPVEAVLAALPRERIWEMHVAAGQGYEGYWLDAHSGIPQDALLALAAEVLPRIPALRAILLEIIPGYLAAAEITAEEIVRCLAALRALAETAGDGRSEMAPSPAPVRPTGAAGAAPPRPSAWEEGFADALAGQAETTVAGFPARDPALPIYRDLISVTRKGSLVGVLPQTLRYLWIVLGEDGLERLFREFWSMAPAEAYPLPEAENLAAFLAGRDLPPFLDDLIALELTQARARALGAEQRVAIACHPERLFDYLSDPGTRPLPTRTPVEVRVAPR